MHTSLLATKFHIPHQRVDLVARPRLLEQRFGGTQTLLDNHRPVRHM